MKVRKNMIAIMLLACVGCMGCAKEQPKTDAGNESKSEDTRNTENGGRPHILSRIPGYCKPEPYSRAKAPSS